MTDALGFNPRTGDHMTKHWPFVIAHDGATGTHYGLFYDNAVEAAFDLGAEHDNYYGLFRGYEAAGGDLDYYVLPGPQLRDVTPLFLRLNGRARRCPRAGHSATHRRRWRSLTRPTPGSAERPSSSLSRGGYSGQLVPHGLGLHVHWAEALRLHLEPR